MKTRTKTKQSPRIVLLGDAGVGKTSLIQRFRDDIFSDCYMPTIGADFTSKTVLINEDPQKLMIWDFSGQERFRCMSQMYIKGSDAFILLFDITNLASFQNLENWMQELKGNEKEYPYIILIATKLDQQHKRQIMQDDIDAFIKKHQTKIYCHIGLSSKTNHGVNRLLESVAACVKFRDHYKNRKIIIDQLDSYIHRIESHQKNGAIDFKYGFWHHKDSRAFNRKANYLLAKDYLNKLKNTNDPINSIFSNSKKSRADLIAEHQLGNSTSIRGINSTTLNKVINQAKKLK